MRLPINPSLVRTRASRAVSCAGLDLPRPILTFETRVGARSSRRIGPRVRVLSLKVKRRSAGAPGPQEHLRDPGGRVRDCCGDRSALRHRGYLAVGGPES